MADPAGFELPPGFLDVLDGERHVGTVGSSSALRATGDSPVAPMRWIWVRFSSSPTYIQKPGTPGMFGRPESASRPSTPE